MRSGHEVAFDHDAHDAVFPGGQLAADVAADGGLLAVVLAAVGMAAVDHDAGCDAGFFHLLGGGVDGCGVEVGDLAAPAQDDVAVGIAGGEQDGCLAGVGGSEEGVRMAGREDGLDGDLNVAGCAVFESDGAGESGGELAVDLALGSARADGAPGDEVGYVLRGDHVEVFGAGGHACFREVEQEAAGHAEAFTDAEGFIEVGIVDEAFPAERGTRLFKVNAHDEHKVAGELGDGFLEQTGVFAGSRGVVNGAWADDDDETIVLSVEDVNNLAARLEDGARGVVGDWHFFLKKDGRKDNFAGFDSEIICGVRHGLLLRILEDGAAYGWEWPCRDAVWLESGKKRVLECIQSGVKCVTMTRNPPGSLEDQVIELRARLGRMEEALRKHGIVLEADAEGFALPGVVAASPEAEASARVAPVVAGISSAAEPRLESVTEQVTFSAPAAGVGLPHRFGFEEHSPPERSLESRIGSQWFNRVGILAVLIGVAWFLKLAFDNHWIGPMGRVAIGLLAGAGLIAWSELFQKRGYVLFSYSLKAIGSGTLYLSLWAAFSVYGLLPGWAAFAAMIAVTAFNGFMAWRRDAELLALYAILGGVSTPLLVSTGGNHEIELFSYLLILDLAVLVLVALRPWSRLVFAAFWGSVFFIFGWWVGFYSQDQAWRTAAFVGCFFLIFALAPRLVRVDFAEPERLSAWDHLAMVVMPLVNACLGFVTFYGLMTPTVAKWAAPWLAVGFAAFYLLVLRLPRRGMLRASPALLSALHVAIAVVFLTIAIPLKTHGRWLTIGWLAEGAALVWLASRLGQRLVQVLALICLVLGLVALVTVNPVTSATPIFNQRFGTYAAAIAVFVLVAWLSWKSGNEQKSALAVPWSGLAGGSVLAVNGLILLAVSLEIHSYWWMLQWRGVVAQTYNYQTYAQFSYSAFFMLFGAALLAVGFWRRSSFLRWQALVLLAVTIAKVFLVDITRLSQGLRIVSFLGLGALLLVVSFAYQRDWLNLRKQGQ